MKERFTVRGLTAAASIWMTASLGIIIGMGFYFAATIAAALTLIVLSAFRWFERLLPVEMYGLLMVRCVIQCSGTGLRTSCFLLTSR